MFSVKSDFGLFGRLFGVPRAWLSKVGAFCSSWTVEGRIIKLERPDNPDPLESPVKLGIDEDALGEFVDARGSEMGEEPVDDTELSELEDLEENDMLEEGTDWQVGSDHGLKLQLFAVYRRNNRGSIFHPVNLEISQSGKIVKMTLVRDKGIELGV